jgi:UDP-N-acetylmuramoyl-tripeptide--D-alanyl-D-alanine ligase
MAGQDLNVLAYSICDPWASMMGAFSANQMDGIEVRLDFPSGEQIFIKTQLHGSFHLYNILAAATIAWEAGSTPGQIKEAAETYRPSNNRSELRTLADGRKVLLDAYNANPTSMQMALENASEVVDGSWAVVLGDMLELGEHSEFEHKILGQLVKRLGPDPVILIGPAMKTAAKEIPDERVYWFPNTETARGTIATLLDGCPFILMKGSRSLAVEGLVDQLEASE